MKSDTRPWLAVPARNLLVLGFVRVALIIGFANCVSAQEVTGDSLRLDTKPPRNQVVATIPVGMQPTSIVVSPDSRFVYVTNWASQTVSVIRAGTKVVKSTITVGGGPTSVAVTPDGKTLYVANEYGSTVSVIDTAHEMVTGTISVGNGPQWLAMSPKRRVSNSMLQIVVTERYRLLTRRPTRFQEILSM
jgi:YVTN family beta-propeller protein